MIVIDFEIVGLHLFDKETLIKRIETFDDRKAVTTDEQYICTHKCVMGSIR